MGRLLPFASVTRRVLVLQTLGKAHLFSPNNAVLTLVRHLDRDRYGLDVAVPRAGLLTEALADAEAGVHIIPGLSTYRRHDALWRLPAVALRTARLARRLSSAAIVANHAELGPFAATAARLSGLPWICFLRQADRPAKYYRKYRVAHAAAVGAVSEAALLAFRRVAQDGSGPPAAVVPTGIELPPASAPGAGTALRERLGWDFSDRVVGCVGLRGVKRPEVLVRIVARAARTLPPLRLLLVGEIGAADRARLESLAAAGGLGGRLHLAGQQADMAPWYAAMDIYAHTSSSEGFPKTVLEAMSHGIPVVAFGVGGIPEAIEDGVSGLLCEPDDEATYADHLARLMTHLDLAARMGVAGRARVAARFSAAAMARGMMDLFDRVLAGSVPRGTGTQRTGATRNLGGTTMRAHPPRGLSRRP